MRKLRVDSSTFWSLLWELRVQITRLGKLSTKTLQNYSKPANSLFKLTPQLFNLLSLPITVKLFKRLFKIILSSLVMLLRWRQSTNLTIRTKSFLFLLPNNIFKFISTVFPTSTVCRPTFHLLELNSVELSSSFRRMASLVILDRCCRVRYRAVLVLDRTSASLRFTIFAATDRNHAGDSCVKTTKISKTPQ